MEPEIETNTEQSTRDESDERHTEQMRRRKASYDACKAAAIREKGCCCGNNDNDWKERKA